MPITLAQPSPLAPGFTAGAGAAQQYSRDLPSLVSLFESLYRGGGGGGHGSSAHNPFPFAAMGGGLGRAQHMGGAGGGGGGGGGMGGQVSPLLISERNEMARLQAAKSAIQMDPSLKDSEKQLMMRQVDAHLNPYVERARAQKAQMDQEKEQAFHKEQALLQSIRQANAEARARGLPFALADVNIGGTMHKIGQDDHGRYHDLTAKHNETEAAKEKERRDHFHKVLAEAHKQNNPPGSLKQSTAQEDQDRAQQIIEQEEELSNPKAAEERQQQRAWEEAQRAMKQRGITPYPFPGEAGAEQGAQQMGTQPLAQPGSAIPHREEDIARQVLPGVLEKANKRLEAKEAQAPTEQEAPSTYDPGFGGF